MLTLACTLLACGQTMIIVCPAQNASAIVTDPRALWNLKLGAH